MEICGINTARLEILKNDEMMELLRRTKQGDMAARERLIRGNLRLVLSVIQRFSSRGENADDLFQVGCIGLSRPSTTLTSVSRCGSPPMAFP